MKRIRDRGFDGGTKYRWETICSLIDTTFTDPVIGVELGVWKGETFKYLLKNSNKLSILYGVDLYQPQPTNNGPEKWLPGENGHAWDHETYYQDLVSFCSKLESPRGIILRKDTTEASIEFMNESIDFVFIDADHGYEGCLRDIQNWSPKVRKGGFIIGHDIHFETVRSAVESYFSTYNTGDDFLWWVRK
jgi:hypothetical protein